MVPLQVSGRTVAALHGFLVYSTSRNEKVKKKKRASVLVLSQLRLPIQGAFFGALGMAVWLHYKKIVKNSHWQYPDVRAPLTLPL